MSQQINLFNPALCSQKARFSATLMLRCLIVLALLMGAVGGYSHYRLSALTTESLSASMQLNSAQQQLDRVRAEHGARPVDAALELQLKQAQAELQALQQTVQILNSGQLGQTAGYAEYFRAFARQIVDGVWLSGAEIAGERIELQGRTMRAESVPAYIGKLQNEPSLHGKSFGTLEIQEPPATPEPPAYLEFRLH